MVVPVTIGDCTLFHDDAVSLLPGLCEFDHFIFDPPYEKHMHEAKREKKTFGANRRIRLDGHANPPPVDFASIDGLREVITPLIIERCRGGFIAFCTPEGIAAWRDAIEAAGAKYKRACFWYKPDAAPQFNGQGPAMGVECFVTAWCGDGVSKWNGGGRRNMFEHVTNAPDRHGVHPTEKPVSLMAEIIQLFTMPGAVICDPFMGSGSTGVACVRTGRAFLGIEKDPKYYDIARQRIDKAHDQTDFFVEIPKKVKREAML